ncbi:MAG TPA: Flp pilus assembly complex ATPase component TadA [Deltaproteobacteria bacterium]|nr:Flp pilus assembly complex ATPase component TadA [Deltaproteobacteria bacterium]
MDILRENPDVIAAGELRDHETIRLAPNAAESCLFVIAPLHSGNFEEAISVCSR